MALLSDWRREQREALTFTRRILRERLRPLLLGESRTVDALLRSVERGARVDPEHTSAMLRGIGVVSRRLWRSVEQVILLGVAEQFRLANGQATRYAAQIEQPAPPRLALPEAVVAAREREARRRHGVNLSRRVYRNDLATTRRVRRLVDQAIAQRWTQARLAAEVRRFIAPDVAGGVSYAAMRLASNELSTAWFDRTREEFQAVGWTSQVYWRTSRRHHLIDACDELRDGSPYPLGQVPRRPHVLCECYLAPGASAAIAARIEDERSA